MSAKEIRKLMEAMDNILKEEDEDLHDLLAGNPKLAAKVNSAMDSASSTDEAIYNGISVLKNAGVKLPSYDTAGFELKSWYYGDLEEGRSPRNYEDEYDDDEMYEDEDDHEYKLEDLDELILSMAETMSPDPDIREQKETWKSIIMQANDMGVSDDTVLRHYYESDDIFSVDDYRRERDDLHRQSKLGDPIRIFNKNPRKIFKR